MPLIDFLAIPHVEYVLSLSGQPLSRSLIKDICVKFHSLQNLIWVSLINVNLNDSSFAELFDGLQHCQQLVQLDLSRNRLADGSMKLLSRMLGPEFVLSDLNLRHNSISCVGVKRIAKELFRNETLENLDLSSNRCEDEGCREIFHSLRLNKFLGSLNLSCNNISREAVPSLCSVLVENATLRNVDVSGNIIGVGISDADFSDLTKAVERSEITCDFANCGFSVTRLAEMNRRQSQFEHRTKIKMRPLSPYSRVHAFKALV